MYNNFQTVFFLWKLKDYLSQVMGAQGIEAELGRGRAGRHLNLSGLGVQTLGWNRNGTI